MKVIKRKLLIFFSILFLFFFFGMISLIIMMNNSEKPSEKNTTEFTATVIYVEMGGTGAEKYGVIYTEEYSSTKLNIFNIKRIGDTNDLQNLQTGQTVFFRINNVWLDQFEEMEFVDIISLRTEEKEIFSLSNYEEYISQQRFAATIVGIVVTLIFLLASIHCAALLKGVNIFRRSKK